MGSRGFRALAGLGFGVQGFGFRVQGLGCRAVVASSFMTRLTRRNKALGEALHAFASGFSAERRAVRLRV